MLDMLSEMLSIAFFLRFRGQVMSWRHRRPGEVENQGHRQNPRVPPTEDTAVPKANDQLPGPAERHAQIQVRIQELLLVSGLYLPLFSGPKSPCIWCYVWWRVYFLMWMNGMEYQSAFIRESVTFQQTFLSLVCPLSDWILLYCPKLYAVLFSAMYCFISRRLCTLCRFFYKFLVANEREVAREIRDDYIETMSKVYFSYFKSYSTRLMKLQVMFYVLCVAVGN